MDIFLFIYGYVFERSQLWDDLPYSFFEWMDDMGKMLIVAQSQSGRYGV